MLEQSVLMQRPLALLRRLFTSFQTHRWQWIGGLLCFAVVNGYIAYRLYRDWGEIQSLGWDWLKPDAPLLGLAALIQLLGALTAIYGWNYILRQFGYQIPFRRHFKVYALSNLARKIPGIGWDILSRVYMYQRDGGDKVQVSVATVVEMTIFGISSALVALVTTMLPGSLTGYINPWWLLGVLAIFAVIIPSPLFRRFLNWLNRGEGGELQLRWHHLFNWALINVVTIFLGGVALFIFCRAFGLVDSSAFVPIVQGWALTMVSGVLLFWLPADLGVTSGIIVLVLGTMMPFPQALVVLIAWRIWNTLNEIIWGGIGFSL
jgi:hypothetical protein